MTLVADTASALRPSRGLDDLLLGESEVAQKARLHQRHHLFSEPVEVGTFCIFARHVVMGEPVASFRRDLDKIVSQGPDRMISSVRNKLGQTITEARLVPKVGLSIDDPRAELYVIAHGGRQRVPPLAPLGSGHKFVGEPRTPAVVHLKGLDREKESRLEELGWAERNTAKEVECALCIGEQLRPLTEDLSESLLDRPER